MEGSKEVMMLNRGPKCLFRRRTFGGCLFTISCRAMFMGSQLSCELKPCPCLGTSTIGLGSKIPVWDFPGRLAAYFLSSTTPELPQYEFGFVSASWSCRHTPSSIRNDFRFVFANGSRAPSSIRDRYYGFTSTSQRWSHTAPILLPARYSIRGRKPWRT
jgi:hypothetical protein